jgi:hypothetical protein
MTASTLDLVPRTATTARGTGSNAEHTARTGYLEPWYPIDRSTTIGQAIARAGSDNYYGWLNHIRAAAGCTRPIRLTGTLDTIDPATGQRLARLSTSDMPDRAIYKACGNRRTSVCPSCAEVYRRDAYQLLRAGLVGGKGVPDSVARHDAVFPTFTAPSFGPVHTRAVSRHTCADRRRCDCRPDPCHARRPGSTPGLCEHGQPAVCFARHESDDPRLGQPLCLDCYDHDHHVVWNRFTGKLWARTKQDIERYLARLCRKRRIPFVQLPTTDGKTRKVPPVRVAHGKAAEFQIRGAVHFHALLRLDGIDPTDPDAVVPPPAGITAADLDDAIHHAVAHTNLTTPPHPDKPEGWRIAWGKEVLVKHITMRGGNQVTDEMVAGYLAKYATKSTEATGHRSARLDHDTIDLHADPDGDHIARLIDACWRLGRPTHTPTPLSARPRSNRPRPGLRSSWTCSGCGKATQLAVCPHCHPSTSSPVDPATADTYVSKPGADNPYAGLRRWAHMLGFGGHFLTKARRYSVTFAFLRDTRIRFRRDHDDQDHADTGTIRTADHTDEETTLIVGALTFAGVGWRTTGDALLANTAADLARSRQQAGREELAHEIGTAIAATTLAAA